MCSSYFWWWSSAKRSAISRTKWVYVTGSYQVMSLEFSYQIYSNKLKSVEIKGVWLIRMASSLSLTFCQQSRLLPSDIVILRTSLTMTQMTSTISSWPESIRGISSPKSTVVTKKITTLLSRRMRSTIMNWKLGTLRFFLKRGIIFVSD